MATYPLVPHPAHPPRHVTRLWVDVEQGGDALSLVYHVENARGLKVSTPGAPERRDELWRTTCFELFAGRPGEAAYTEYNFAPSGAWAAYAFDAPRTGMRDLETSVAPLIMTDSTGDAFLLRARVTAPFPEAAQLNLTAVIEEEDGTRSFWALRHADGAPDFHARDCFVATLPAPVAA